MSWNQNQINEHIKAAGLLNQIKNKVFKYIQAEGNKVTEYNVQQYILQQYKLFNFKTDKILPIVAFRENTSFVHYHPSQYSKSLVTESLIMIDLWARLNQKNAPFADITWMAYRGKRISKQILEIFNFVLAARDSAVNFILASLKNGRVPTGAEVDKSARDVIDSGNYSGCFKHTTGHILGLTSAHGLGGRIGKDNKKTLLINVGYTIEPGIYLKDKFGVRSEIDFYINEQRKMIITTRAQDKITII